MKLTKPAETILLLIIEALLGTWLIVMVDKVGYLLAWLPLIAFNFKFRKRIMDILNIQIDE